jgi:hypothetical protein
MLLFLGRWNLSKVKLLCSKNPQTPRLKINIVCNVSKSNKEKCGNILWYYVQNR